MYILIIQTTAQKKNYRKQIDNYGRYKPTYDMRHDIKCVTVSKEGNPFLSLLYYLLSKETKFVAIQHCLKTTLSVKVYWM